MDPALAARCLRMGTVRQERTTTGGGPGGQGSDDGVEEIVRAGQRAPVPAQVQPWRLLFEGRQQEAEAFGFRDAPALVAAPVQAPDLQGCCRVDLGQAS